MCAEPMSKLPIGDCAIGHEVGVAEVCKMKNNVRDEHPDFLPSFPQ